MTDYAKPTLSRLEEGYQSFTFGPNEPDFMSAHPRTVVAIIELLAPIHKQYYGANLVREKFNRWGTVFNNAIVVPDDALPEGVVRYESATYPDHPHLNGVWTL